MEDTVSMDVDDSSPQGPNVCNATNRDFTENVQNCAITQLGKKGVDEALLKTINAVLNSGGGIVRMKINAFSKYKPEELNVNFDGFWQALEQKLNPMIQPSTYGDVFDRKWDGDTVLLLIRATKHLCTMDYNLYLPFDAASLPRPPYEKVVDLLSRRDSLENHTPEVPLTELPMDLLPKNFTYKEVLNRRESKWKCHKSGGLFDNNNQKGQDKIAKHISSLGNGTGGLILFGIEDNGKICGVDIQGDHGKAYWESGFQAMINEMRKTWNFTPKQREHWDIEFFPVDGTKSGFVIVVLIAGMRNLGGIFTKCPKSFVLQNPSGSDGGEEIVALDFSEWKQKMLRSTCLGPSKDDSLKTQTSLETERMASQLQTELHEDDSFTAQSSVETKRKATQQQTELHEDDSVKAQSSVETKRKASHQQTELHEKYLYGSRKVKVTILAFEWGSSEGGLSTINRELAIQLAKCPEVEITFFVPQFSEKDMEVALKHKVKIVGATPVPGFEQLDWLSFPPKDLQIDIIVGHGVKLGEKAQHIKRSKRCKWVQVVHSDPEELGMFKNYPDSISKGEKKHKTQVELCKIADHVVGVGPKLSEAFRTYLRSYQKDDNVVDFTPGVFVEFATVKQTLSERQHRCVLVFGRGDVEDFKLKGFDIAGKAVAELEDTRLVFVGAPDGKHNEIAKRFTECGVPASRLRVRGFVEDRESLKCLFQEVDLVVMPSRTEGFGLIGLEALSAGVPVLVSGNSGFGEALCNVVHGSSFVVNSEDPNVWTAAITNIWAKDRKSRLEEAETLRYSYEKKYNWATQTEDLVAKMITWIYDDSLKAQTSLETERMASQLQTELHKGDSSTAQSSVETKRKASQQQTELHEDDSVKAQSSVETKRKDSHQQTELHEDDSSEAQSSIEYSLMASQGTDDMPTEPHEELEKAATILEGGGTFSTEPLGNLDSGDALGHEMIEKIVIATVEFEANHKECLRVLPYLDSAGEVVVQLFVFSEFGLQTSLKSSAQEYFDEKKVKLVWSDLYNNAAYVLNATSVQYPSGEPKRLNATDVDNMNQTINSNLHVLVKHRNITAVQASYKITNSKQTEKACITIYVLGKGFIPIGESTFPPFLGSYPVDVVNGFWYRTKIPQTPTKTQVPSDELCLGTSIGVKGQAGGGTLGAIVKDSSSGIFYALSCNHVMKHTEESEIIHPALADYVNYLNWHLTEYAKWVKNTISRDQVITQKSRFASNFLEDKADLSEKFKELNQIRDAHRDPDRETPTNVQLADNHKKWFEEGESKPPRVIGKYIAGVSRNVKWSDGQEYYIDAAVAQLTEKEVKLLQLSKVARIIGTGDYPSGELRPAKDATHSTKYLCKSGRTTEFTNPGYLVDSSIILKGSFHEANGSLTNVFRQVGFCQSCAKRCGLTKFPESTPPPPCDSCIKSTDYLCQNLWFKSCLCIKHTLKKAFSDDGDSGAVVFERHASEDEDEDEDEHNGLLGFGIIFAGMEHLGVDRPVSLASPLEVALDALSKEISNNSRLKLVSDYNE